MALKISFQICFLYLQKLSYLRNSFYSKFLNLLFRFAKIVVFKKYQLLTIVIFFSCNSRKAILNRKGVIIIKKLEYIISVIYIRPVFNVNKSLFF